MSEQSTDNDVQSDEPVIAVAGPTCVDITLRNPPADWHGGAGSDIFAPGLIKPMASPAEIVLGGNGAAAAFVMARLGRQVRLITQIGDDNGGQLAHRWLQEAGVDLITAPSASTMFTVMAVDDDGRRTGGLQYPGTPVDWQAAAQCEAGWLLVATHAQASRDDFENIAVALKTTRRSGRNTAFDCGISWLDTMPVAEMHAVWQQTDLVIGTQDELGAWTNCSDPQRIAAAVLDHGPRQVIVKLGADGAAWQGRDEPYAHHPACKLERVDVTIGAGDGFNGGALAALANGRSIRDAVDAGQAVAAAVVKSGRGVLGWGQTK